jgi:hypothetical protein
LHIAVNVGAVEGKPPEPNHCKGRGLKTTTKAIRLKATCAAAHCEVGIGFHHSLLIYVEFPRLFIQRRNAFSSLDTWASSGNVSRKDICFVWVESPFLQGELNISLTSLNSLQTRKGKKGRNNKSSIHLDKHECKKQEEEHLIKKIYTN